MKNYTNQLQKIALVVILSLLSFGSVFAQAETAKIKDGTISNGAAKAKDGAIFELESNNKGMLISRMSTAQRNAIPTANLSNGLLVFNTNTNCFDYWDSLRIQWLSMCGTPPPAVFDVSAAQCSAVVANGTYKQGVTLSGDNTLTVPVTVTQSGTYTMTATTANGYYFEASGNFPTAGVYDITLRGTGRPSTGYATGDPGDTVSLILNGVVCDCTPHIYVEKANVDFAISCGSLNVLGSYNIGLDLTSSNKLTIEVNVTNLGYWSMKTNTVNGYSFTGQGTFTVTGPQTVELLGTGKPTASGTDIFNLSSNASTVAGGSCSGISVTVAPVAYTMDCSKATQAGAYMQNVALNPSTNTISLPVNVTATGSTTITTNTINGISFSSGPIVLTKLGADTVVLKGSGTPLSGTTTALTFTGTPGATATCSYNLIIAQQPVAYTMTCGSITTAGNYVPGVVMDPAANTMTVSVNVTYVGDYDISTDVVNGISFSKKGTFATTGTQSVVLEASGTPTSGGTFTYKVSTNSTSSTSTCTKSILFTYRTMNVLGMGEGIYQPASASASYSARSILSPSNFGPTGTVQMKESFKFVNGGYSVGAALKKLINDNKIDIIYVGYNWYYYTDAATIKVLSDFVKIKKGVLIFANERYQAKDVIDAICDANVTISATNNGYVYNVSNASDPSLNGPFGDLRGKLLGGDGANSVFVSSGAPANTTVLATQGSNIYSLKHNTLGFVFLGDGGFNCGYSGYGDNVTTTYPAFASTTGTPLSKAYNGGTIYNSIMYANLMAWAIDYSQTNTDTSYIIN
ncbi:hypothetical protein [Flavobacterium sp. N2038]|uniref:hypothetical protein n=1 Tax=Flavobacterium sp. N2038 TaxID=2986829 RepID=UPI0022249582|nr:hypothetical protein [Flavobacterium sp. N2038]